MPYFHPYSPNTHTLPNSVSEVPPTTISCLQSAPHRYPPCPAAIDQACVLACPPHKGRVRHSMHVQKLAR